MRINQAAMRRARNRHPKGAPLAKSIYPAIYRALRDEITAGAYPFQTLLPTEAQLCERFGCSHSVVRRALRELADEGLVQPRQGRGVTVIWQPERRGAHGYATGGLDTFPETCAARGLVPETRLLAFERLTADDALARQTDFAPGTPLVHLLRLRIASGTPVAVEENYTSEREVPGITPAIAISGTYAHIEHTLGMKILTSRRTITMRPAGPTDGPLLDLDPDAYLAFVESHTFASTGNQFEVIYSRQHPDFFSAQIIATRPSR